MVRGGFLEFMRSTALSLEGRGALWTLLDFEDQVLSGGVVLGLLGADWRRIAEELRKGGYIRVEKVDGELREEAYRFRVVKTVQARRREKDRARKARKARKAGGTSTAGGLEG